MDNELFSLLIKFALFSGRRRGEILTLKWKDVNLEAGHVTFIGTTTKNKRTQSVPLNANGLAILIQCYKLKLSEWICPSHSGSFFHSFEATWARLKRRLKFPYRFHDLRHSFASYLASSGKVDILTLKELIGHRELKMTQRYAHLINGALQKGVNIADEVIK